MNDIKTIPYGISDFVRIRQDNAYFIDRTNLIPVLEKTAFVLFLRPRRFGKSLLVSLLECYYETLLAGQFDDLFKGTKIHAAPTSAHNSSLVLTFNFSAVIKESNLAQESFNEYCCMSLDAFVTQHKELLPSRTVEAVYAATDSHLKLNALTTTLKGTSAKLYVMIDEYDNFTNTILASEGLEAYNNLCHGEGFFKQFFNELKAAATGTNSSIERIFITGVSPVTLDDVTSGFNIARNLSMDGDVADLLGFRKEELLEMLEYYTSVGEFKLDIDSSLRTMLEWYNNYCFSPNNPIKVCNPTLVLGFMLNAFHLTTLPEILYDENMRIDYAKLRHLVTLNNHLNGNFHTLETLLSDGEIHENIVRSFQANDMTSPANFISLLYYVGMLAMDGTYRGITTLRIPNHTMRYFLNSFITDGYRRACNINVRTAELTRALSNLAYDGNWHPCMNLVSDIIHECFATRDGIEGEKVIQADMTALLSVASNAFIVQSEYNANGGYADIALAPFLLKFPDMTYAALIELKYLKRHESCSPELLKRLKSEAAQLLTHYTTDNHLGRLWQLTTHGGPIHLIRLAVIFQGGDMRLCEEV